MSLTTSEARALVRKRVKRVPEGESITHLNIMPMMDMMTILLVAFIAQMTATEILLPQGFTTADSATQDKLPQHSIVMFVTRTEISIGTQDSQMTAAKLTPDGSVEPCTKLDSEGLCAKFEPLPAGAVTIPMISDYLAAWKKRVVDDAKNKGRAPPGNIDEIFLVADEDTPYRLLYNLLATSRSAPANYKHFRLVTSSQEEILPPQ